jgi:putative ABC transport system permease protein
MPAVRHELALLEPNVSVVSLLPYTLRMQSTLQRRRFNTLLLAIFAALAMALTSVGIYGILNHWVGLRQKEISIRMALGAKQTEILRWTGWHVALMVAVGIAAGTFGCWGASRVLGSMVFGISAQNPFMFLAASAVVIAVAALAASVPVWRAVRVDPMRHLQDV